MLSSLVHCSVQFSRSVVSDSLRPHGLQHARPPCPSPSPEFTQTHTHCLWCHPILPSSVVPVSSCLQSFPALAPHSCWICSDWIKILEQRGDPPCQWSQKCKLEQAAHGTIFHTCQNSKMLKHRPFLLLKWIWGTGTRCLGLGLHHCGYF